MRRLWYEAPAVEWEEALPLGNGRMGAMVYGGIAKEQIQVNEESIWYGAKKNRANEDSLENLPKIRELLFAGRIEEAEQLMKWSMSGCPKSMPCFQTLGDILVEFYHPAEHGLEQMVRAGEASGYYRELDLEQAMAQVRFEMNGVRYTREYFFSHPADALVIKYTASKAGALNFVVNLDRCKNMYDGIHKAGENGLCLYGNLGRGGFEYAMTVKVQTEQGTVKTIGNHLIVQNAAEAVLVFSADCSFHYQKEITCDAEADEMQEMMQKSLSGKLVKLLTESYDVLLEEHKKDYQELFLRTSLTLEDTDKYDTMPTDKRLLLAQEGQEAGLAALYLDYGRYLLISCSRPGGLPANLQGIWNKSLKPAWDSKYTININTEMNYWLAENANLSECHMPLFEQIKKMLPNGQRAARELYGCRGFVAHHNTDVYGDCCVQDYWNPGSYWVMGAAWLCTHQWTHYLYTKDEVFLREAFPVMREAALFFMDYLVEYEGHLVTCPSVSPENTFILSNGHSGANTYGVTMDNQILTDLFDQCNKAAEILGISDELDEQIREAKKKLYPMQIAKEGYLMEWPQDYEEKDKGHRHISHLYGLHPSEQITKDGTPELAEAAEKTLERRLANGGGHTGWSRAWIINDYAKLWDGEKAYENLLQLFAKSTYANLFDKHPPFQIDGNFGAAAAIIEMLVQSSEERVVLLPALPHAWKSGKLTGVRIKCGGTVDMEWQEGTLTYARITVPTEQTLCVRYGQREWNMTLSCGGQAELF